MVLDRWGVGISVMVVREEKEGRLFAAWLWSVGTAAVCDLFRVDDKVNGSLGREI